MINKTVLKQILASNQKDVENYQVMPRELPSDEFERRVFIGVRRAGKRRCSRNLPKVMAGTVCFI